MLRVGIPTRSFPPAKTIFIHRPYRLHLHRLQPQPTHVRLISSRYNLAPEPQHFINKACDYQSPSHVPSIRMPRFILDDFLCVTASYIDTNGIIAVELLDSLFYRCRFTATSYTPAAMWVDAPRRYSATKTRMPLRRALGTRAVTGSCNTDVERRVTVKNRERRTFRPQVYINCDLGGVSRVSRTSIADATENCGAVWDE